MNWGFFDEIYVLNQKERPDRLTLCEDELHRVGIYNFSLFHSIPADPPMRSFCISQHEILKNIARDGNEKTLVLEDDIVFDWLDPLEASIEQLPSNWDILYLGCNLRGIIPKTYTRNLVIPSSPWMTHAIGYSKHGAKYIAGNYDPLSNQMFDDWLSHHVAALNVFCVWPMIAGQRPGFSNLWGANTDYSETIKQGNQLL